MIFGLASGVSSRLECSHIEIVEDEVHSWNDSLIQSNPTMFETSSV